jgi:hypothetical protein
MKKVCITLPNIIPFTELYTACMVILSFQMCVQMALQTAKNGHNVFFIDTGANFDIVRAHCMLAKTEQSEKVLRHYSCSNVMRMCLQF